MADSVKFGKTKAELLVFGSSVCTKKEGFDVKTFLLSDVEK